MPQAGEATTADTQGKNRPKRTTPGLVFKLLWAELVKGQELHGVPPVKGLDRLPKVGGREKARGGNFGHPLN